MGILLAHHSQHPKPFPESYLKGVDMIVCCHPQALPEEQRALHITSFYGQDSWAGKLDYLFLGDELEIYLDDKSRLSKEEVA